MDNLIEADVLDAISLKLHRKKKTLGWQFWVFFNYPTEQDKTIFNHLGLNV